MSFKKIPLLFKVLSVILIVFGLGFFFFFKNKNNSTVSYQTTEAQKGNLVVSLSASGQISSSNTRSVTTTASGVVSKVYVKEGQKVAVGTPIALIDLDLDGRRTRDSAYTSYLSAQNNLESTKNSLYNLQSLVASTYDKFHNDAGARGLATDDVTYVTQYSAYTTAQNNLNNYQSTLKIAQLNVANAYAAYQKAGATIYAPISGTISGISLTKGMVITSSTSDSKVANIVTGSNPTISISLTESDIFKVSVGNQATVILDTIADKTFSGTVLSVDKAGSVSSGVVSYPVTILLDSNSPDIFPNMSATVKVITQIKSDVILIPSTAITKTNGNAVVHVLKDGKASTVNVTTGSVGDSETEITSGISAGDQVITNFATVNKTSTSKSSSSSTSVFSTTNRGFGGVMVR